MEGGGWRVEGGGWRVEGGGWRVEGSVHLFCIVCLSGLSGFVWFVGLSVCVYVCVCLSTC